MISMRSFAWFAVYFSIQIYSCFSLSPSLFFIIQYVIVSGTENVGLFGTFALPPSLSLSVITIQNTNVILCQWVKSV